jgi:hypothetical protein
MDINIDINSIIDSAQAGQWLLFAGLLLTAIVQIVRKLLPLLKGIPKPALPWVIFALGVLAAGGGVLGGGGSWVAAIIAGVTVGATSLGAYDLVSGPLAGLLAKLTKGTIEKTPAEGKLEAGGTPPSDVPADKE